MLGDPKLTHEKHDDIYWCDILLNSKVSSCIATRNKYTLKFIYIYLLVVEIRIFWPFWKWSLHPRFSYYLELVPACKKWRYGFYGLKKFFLNLSKYYRIFKLGFKFFCGCLLILVCSQKTIILFTLPFGCHGNHSIVKRHI